ncbi:hypothetical protein HN51_058399 [Arachis hypogaea]
MDFPVLNESFIPVKNKYAYTQVVDPNASFVTDSPLSLKKKGVSKWKKKKMMVRSLLLFTMKTLTYHN